MIAAVNICRNLLRFLLFDLQVGCWKIAENNVVKSDRNLRRMEFTCGRRIFRLMASAVQSLI
jgi:hypothetical protein